MKTLCRIDIVIITGVFATFVLYLCAAVSKLPPFLFATILIVLAAVLAVPQVKTFAAIVRCIQKRE